MILIVSGHPALLQRLFHIGFGPVVFIVIPFQAIVISDARGVGSGDDPEFLIRIEIPAVISGIQKTVFDDHAGDTIEDSVIIVLEMVGRFSVWPVVLRGIGGLTASRRDTCIHFQTVQYGIGQRIIGVFLSVGIIQTVGHQCQTAGTSSGIQMKTHHRI